MLHFWRCALVGLLVVCGVAAGGCRRPRPRVTAPQVFRTKAEFFRAKQAATVTPFGAIDLDSVKETPDGVEYRTADGKRWKVVMEPAGDGYRLREPEQLK
jgi:hypothetical protein